MHLGTTAGSWFHRTKDFEHTHLKLYRRVERLFYTYAVKGDNGGMTAGSSSRAQCRESGTAPLHNAAGKWCEVTRGPRRSTQLHFTPLESILRTQARWL